MAATTYPIPVGTQASGRCPPPVRQGPATSVLVSTSPPAPASPSGAGGLPTTALTRRAPR